MGFWYSKYASSKSINNDDIMTIKEGYQKEYDFLLDKTKFEKFRSMYKIPLDNLEDILKRFNEKLKYSELRISRADYQEGIKRILEFIRETHYLDPAHFKVQFLDTYKEDYNEFECPMSLPKRDVEWRDEYNRIFKRILRYVPTKYRSIIKDNLCKLFSDFDGKFMYIVDNWCTKEDGALLFDYVFYPSKSNNPGEKFKMTGTEFRRRMESILGKIARRLKSLEKKGEPIVPRRGKGIKLVSKDIYKGGIPHYETDRSRIRKELYLFDL